MIVLLLGYYYLLNAKYKQIINKKGRLIKPAKKI